jgi:hypothetical protein
MSCSANATTCEITGCTSNCALMCNGAQGCQSSCDLSSGCATVP